MCGIAGILQKRAGAYPIGQALLTMAACLQHRGRDSAGIAVFAVPDGTRRLQMMLPEGAETLPEPQTVLALGEGRLSGLEAFSGGFRAVLAASPGPAEEFALVQRLENALSGGTVCALGESLTMQKAVGLADGLREGGCLLTGTHGVAHLRLATESRIDPAHAQPFWGRPYADIAVTHNGHITNYHKLRQRFEAQGFTLASQNDSEIIGIYLGSKIAQGRTLQEALLEASHELDGSYSFIAATRDGLGVARDPFATKPLLYVETEDVVALASEQQALHRLLGEEIVIQEIRPREVRTWAKA